MAFSRNSLVATVAGSLSLAVLTGCPSAPTQPLASATPAATASSAATAAPTTAPSGATNSAAPTTAPSGTTTSTAPSTVTSAPPASGKLTILSGNVYDEAAATVDGAVVKVTSLDASVPYSASTTTSAGSYVVNNVPEGANVEITVSKDGWTSRRRVGSFQTQANQKNEVNFGGTGTLANGGTDPGQAYFISKYPEISAVEPAYDASNVDPASVSYKLTLSEALDDVNRRRFEDSIRLLPANSYAAPENDGANTNSTGANAFSAANPSDPQYFNLKDQKIKPGTTPALVVIPGAATDASNNYNLDRSVDPDPASYGFVTGNPNAFTAGLDANGKNHPQTALNTAGSNRVPFDYSIKKGTLFLDDSTTRATVTWNADNTQATLTFAAPLVTDRTNNAKYQLALVTTSTSDKIVDKDNNQLGMDASGSLQSYPAGIGVLLHATVRQPDLSILSTDNTAALRWVRTHQDAGLFSVSVDNKDPQLVSVAYTKNLGSSSRFEFTFDSPMAAYNGRTGGHVHSSISSGSFLRTTSLAVSDRAGGTKNVDLKGTTTSTIPAAELTPANGFGSAAEIEKEYKLANPDTTVAFPNGGLVTYGTALATAEGVVANAGRYLVQVDPRNPKTVFVYVIKVTNIFKTNITELKTRTEGIGDPAGNTVKSSDADKQQIQGSI